MTTAQRIRAARESARMTQEDAAHWSGVSREHLSDIERGRYEPRLSTLRKLSCTYGTTVSALIGEEPPPVQALTLQERAVLAALRNHQGN